MPTQRPTRRPTILPTAPPTTPPTALPTSSAPTTPAPSGSPTVGPTPDPVRSGDLVLVCCSGSNNAAHWNIQDQVRVGPGLWGYAHTMYEVSNSFTNVTGQVSVLGTTVTSMNGTFLVLQGIGQHLRIHSNNALTSMDDTFPALQSVGADVDVGNNDLLTSMDGVFPALEEVGGNIDVGNNDLLTSMDGVFPALEEVRGELYVHHSPALTSTNGAFPVLRWVRGRKLHIEALTALTSLDGTFPVLQGVTGFISINYNAALTSMVGAFPALQEVGDRLYMGNPALTSMNGAFPMLQRVGGGLTVSQAQRRLTSMNGAFPELLEVGGGVYVKYNDALTSMDGAFPKLLAIRGGLRVQFNNALTSLGTAFRSLRRIEGMIWFRNNSRLTDFEALRNLTCHGGVYAHALDTHFSRTLNDPPYNCQGCPIWLLALPACEAESPSSAPTTLGPTVASADVGSCENGILPSAGGNICCAAECGSCSGDGCGARPGGPTRCCGGTIRDVGRSCADFPPPCVVPTSATSTQTTTPASTTHTSSATTTETTTPSTTPSYGQLECLRYGGASYLVSSGSDEECAAQAALLNEAIAMCSGSDGSIACSQVGLDGKAGFYNSAGCSITDAAVGLNEMVFRYSQRTSNSSFACGIGGHFSDDNATTCSETVGLLNGAVTAHSAGHMDDCVYTTPTTSATTTNTTTPRPTTTFTTSSPTTANPTTANPTTANPTTANPTTANPTANPTSTTTTNPTANPTVSPTSSTPSGDSTSSSPSAAPTAPSDCPQGQQMQYVATFKDRQFTSTVPHPDPPAARHLDQSRC